METRTIECVAFFYHEGAKGDNFIRKISFDAASIYNKCMVKVGSLMLYNLRIFEESSHSEISMIYQLKIPVKQLSKCEIMH